MKRMNEKRNYALHEYCYMYAVLYSRIESNIQNKFQNKTKTKLCQISATLCCHFCLAKFGQVSYIIKNQASAKNILCINISLKNMTLR